MGTLRTRVWRAKFTEGQERVCPLCEVTEETMEHLILRCQHIGPKPLTTTLSIIQGFQSDGEEQETPEGLDEQREQLEWQRKDICLTMDVTKRRLEGDATAGEEHGGGCISHPIADTDGRDSGSGDHWLNPESKVLCSPAPMGKSKDPIQFKGHEACDGVRVPADR